MTKMNQSDFEMNVIVGEPPKVLTRAEKLTAWKREHHIEYVKAKDAICVCTPTRAQLLLADMYEGNGPSDL
jgi:hypothetical protein